MNDEKHARAPVPIDRVVEQLVNLGVQEGAVLLVHTSFRAVGPVEGGPQGLIEALSRAIGPGGTLVMPSWPGRSATLFDPHTTDASHDLGIVAREFWRCREVRRTRHVQAFAARGPAAESILADPLPLPPHIAASPVGRVHELGGHVLLLGVNHDADTTIHLAEVIAGVPYGVRKTCLTVIDGSSREVEYLENDHCCSRFRLVDEWLRNSGDQAEGKVGHAMARLARSTDIVASVVARLRQDPLLFLHSATHGCEECDAARESVP